MSLLAIDQLVKTFNEFSLGPLTMSVEAGCSVGLVGANGAGKTTLFRTIMGTLRPQQGEIEVAGIRATDSDQSHKNQIGYVGDYTALFSHWSGHKNLRGFREFYSNWSDDIAIDTARKLDLDLNKKPKTYSTGQRAKMAIVIALASRPRLLLLDEPTSGLDPVSREAFMALLFEFLSDESHSLIYATHHIAEIEQLSDKLVFLSNGQLVRDEIKEDLAENWKRISFRSESLPLNIPHMISHKGEHPYHEIVSDKGSATLEFLKQQGVENVESTRLPIEKIAVEILKTSAREINHV